MHILYWRVDLRAWGGKRTKWDKKGANPICLWVIFYYYYYYESLGQRQDTIQLRMTLSVNKRLRHLATDSHPSLLRLSDVDSSLSGNNGGQPRKILKGRKSWKEANSRFCSGELQTFWELSASMGKFRWIKRILGNVSLTFLQKQWKVVKIETI